MVTFHPIDPADVAKAFERVATRPNALRDTVVDFTNSEHNEVAIDRAEVGLRDRSGEPRTAEDTATKLTSWARRYGWPVEAAATSDGMIALRRTSEVADGRRLPQAAGRKPGVATAKPRNGKGAKAKAEAA